MHLNDKTTTGLKVHGLTWWIKITTFLSNKWKKELKSHYSYSCFENK
jgi:hypothetical protein